MKFATKLATKIINKLSIPFKIVNSRQFLIYTAIVLAISLVSTLTTYQILSKRLPKIAVVDLLYLNNEFTVNLARYLTENQVNDEQVSQAVKDYLANLETLLSDISHSSNYLLLQKQTVISSQLPDITKDLEKVLFETVVNKTTSTNLAKNLTKNQATNLAKETKTTKNNIDQTMEE